MKKTRLVSHLGNSPFFLYCCCYCCYFSVFLLFFVFVFNYVFLVGESTAFCLEYMLDQVHIQRKNSTYCIVTPSHFVLIDCEFWRELWHGKVGMKSSPQLLAIYQSRFWRESPAFGKPSGQEWHLTFDEFKATFMPCTKRIGNIPYLCGQSEYGWYNPSVLWFHTHCIILELLDQTSRKRWLSYHTRRDGSIWCKFSDSYQSN